jgi:hypothetical protein
MLVSPVTLFFRLQKDVPDFGEQQLDELVLGREASAVGIVTCQSHTFSFDM